MQINLPKHLICSGRPLQTYVDPYVDSFEQGF